MQWVRTRSSDIEVSVGIHVTEFCNEDTGDIKVLYLPGSCRVYLSIDDACDVKLFRINFQGTRVSSPVPKPAATWRHPPDRHTHTHTQGDGLSSLPLTWWVGGFGRRDWCMWKLGPLPFSSGGWWLQEEHTLVCVFVWCVFQAQHWCKVPEAESESIGYWVHCCGGGQALALLSQV